MNTGAGPAGMFVATSPTSLASGLLVQYAGKGKAVEGRVTSELGNAAWFENTANNRRPVVAAVNRGEHSAGLFQIVNQNNDDPAIDVQSFGTGWAGRFQGNLGVQIVTNGNQPGLQVLNGTKNAVVTTTNGARSLYTEESSEVWFTDYGFGKLEDGRARILIDPSFAQTVSLDQPYHVFVQPYGDAELYVKARTSLGFVVVAREGDGNAEFGFRVVAKRSGFETQRLERAPWADGSPGLEPH